MKLRNMMALLGALGLVASGISAGFYGNEDVEKWQKGTIAGQLNKAGYGKKPPTVMPGTEQRAATAQSRGILSGPLRERLNPAKNIADKLKQYQGQAAFDEIKKLNAQGAFKDLTIAEILEIIPALATLRAGLVANNLLEPLRVKTASLTLIAPTNEAFKKIQLTQLPGNAPLFKHHIITNKKIPVSILTAPRAINTTAANKQLLGSDLTDKIAVADIQAKNGTVHIASEVILGRESSPIEIGTRIGR